MNADGYREILGLHVTSAEDGAGRLAFFRDLTARGLSGVALVTSDAHRGLTVAIGAALPGASWQRCRTHYAANLMAVTPKSAWGWVRALLHSVYDQPDDASVRAPVRARGGEAQEAEAGVISVRMWPVMLRARTCAGHGNHGSQWWIAPDRPAASRSVPR